MEAENDKSNNSEQSVLYGDKVSILAIKSTVEGIIITYFFHGKLKVNNPPVFLYEAETQTGYNKWENQKTFMLSGGHR